MIRRWRAEDGHRERWCAGCGAPTSDRFTAARRGFGFWVALWTLAVAAEFGALVPIIFGDAPVEGADVVYRLVGGSFAAFGLVAWHRRPDSRSGPLMTATGFGLLVSLLLKQIHTGVALTAGEVLEDIWAPAFVALVLSFVTGGRLVSRVDRLIVAGSSSPPSSWTSSRCCSSSSRATCCSLPERDDLWRHRHDAARDEYRALPRDVRRDRRTLARGLAAAAPGAAAERRRRRVHADVRVAARRPTSSRARGRSS